MKVQPSPFKCHLFVCINDRKGTKKSCADRNSQAVRLALKQQFRERDVEGVRVTQSLCLGVCDDGPNIMMYPQKLWFSDVTIDDVPEIVDKVIGLIE